MHSTPVGLELDFRRPAARYASCCGGFGGVVYFLFFSRMEREQRRHDRRKKMKFYVVVGRFVVGQSQVCPPIVPSEPNSPIRAVVISF